MGGCQPHSLKKARQIQHYRGFLSNSSNNQPNASLTMQHSTIVFALVILAAFLDIVDFSIIQVALPTIREQFAITLADSQWIVGAYGLTLAGFLLLSGRAGDIYGQKRLFVAGVALFSVASLTGGMAPSLLSLVVSRAVQGVAAAVSTVTALAIFTAIFPEGERRNRALGVLVAVLSAGFAAGSLTGGVLTAAFGWRSVLFVNVPIGALTAALSVKYLPRTRGRAPKTDLDLPGGLSVTAGILLLVYALTNASSVGFGAAETLVPLGLAATALAGFLFIESRSKSPLMPLDFLRRGAVLMANILGLIVAAASGGLGFIVTIYMQQILGYSALQTGLAFLPAAIVFLFVGGWGAPRLVNRLGMKRVLLLSMSLIVAGNVLLTQISVNATFLSVEPGSILWAFGASIGFPALFIAALAGTKPGEEGLASGLITTSQRVGFPLGLAALLTVASVVDPTPFGSSGASASPSLVVMGFQYAFVAATVMSVIGLLIVFRMKNPENQWQQQNQMPSG